MVSFRLVFTYQLSFSSKIRKRSANSSTSFRTPKLLEKGTLFIKVNTSTITYSPLNHTSALYELNDINKNDLG